MGRPLLSLWPFAWRMVFAIALFAGGLLALSSVLSGTLADRLALVLVVESVFLFLAGLACWHLLGSLVWRVWRFRTLTGPRFVLHYAAELEARCDLPVLRQRLEAELDDLTDLFGFPLRGRPVVFFFSSYKALPPLAGTGKHGLAIIPANAICLAADTNLRVMMRHELAHLFAAHWRLLAPGLLFEGLPTWLQGTWGGRPLDGKAAALLRNGGVPLSSLLGRQPFLKGPRRSTCYVLAGSFTGFLVRRFGWDRYRTLYRKAGLVRFAATFRKVLGLSLAEAERQWRDEVLAANRLLSVVDRFSAQLKREGYRVKYEMAEEFYVISACERDSRAVAQYIARLEDGGVHIDEVRDLTP
jgi:hypothetical protein